METNTDYNDRYPIGDFVKPESYSVSLVKDNIESIENLPALLRQAVTDLTNNQLDTPYREGGWTIRQVVHHVADSHMNAYCRFKLAITEHNATIRPYDQDLWSETDDAKYGPVEISLNLIEALHQRWSIFLKSLGEDDFQKAFYHPEYNKKIFLYESLAQYAWHGKHHLHHVKNVVKKKEW